MKPIIDYFAASRAELTKVTWPNRRQTTKLTLMVILFALAFAVLLGVLDYSFSWLLQTLIIKG